MPQDAPYAVLAQVLAEMGLQIPGLTEEMLEQTRELLQNWDILVVATIITITIIDLCRGRDCWWYYLLLFWFLTAGLRVILALDPWIALAIGVALGILVRW